MFPKRLVIIIVMMMIMMKCIVILVFIGTTRIITKGLIEYLKAISGNHSIYSIQKTPVLGTLHIMRKYYSLENGNEDIERNTIKSILHNNEYNTKLIRKPPPPQKQNIR
jgi:hypothetical protein